MKIGIVMHRPSSHSVENVGMSILEIAVDKTRLLY
jgi:hypothetical protein